MKTLLQNTIEKMQARRHNTRKGIQDLFMIINELNVRLPCANGVKIVGECFTATGEYDPNIHNDDNRYFKNNSCNVIYDDNKIFIGHRNEGKVDKLSAVDFEKFVNSLESVLKKLESLDTLESGSRQVSDLLTSINSSESIESIK